MAAAQRQQLSDEFLQQCNNLNNLRVLQLRSTQISDVGLKALTSCFLIRQLDLRGTKVTPQGIAEFQSRFPDCSIAADFPAK